MLYKSRSNRRRTTLILLGATLALSAFASPGCKFLHRGEARNATASKPVVHTTAILPVDLTKVQPNEAGQVPILMYHDLVATGKARGLQYPSVRFLKDIQWLYDHKYRPVSLTQFVQGKIDCPAGMSPVILTFDDGLRGQFNYTSDGKIDPNCAVGILDAFHQTHPDWQTRGTFFVLTDQDPKLPPPFYQSQYAQGKMEYLVKEGYDIGNHTVHHMHMNKLSPDRVKYEIALAITGIHKYLPDYDINTLALPYGNYPKDEKLLISGESGGVSYSNIAVLRAAWRPVISPIDKGFNPYELERMTPGDKFGQSHWWLNSLEKNKANKFVSDGDPNTFTINAIGKGQVDMAKIKKAHLHFRTYTGTQMGTAS